jgi:predicted ATPase
MEALRATFERAMGGEAQVMDVVGEAGVGKSRLIYEFHKAVGQEALFLSGICLQYGRSMNFLPVRDVVKEAFGLREGMDEETVKGRIKQQSADNLAQFRFHEVISQRVGTIPDGINLIVISRHGPPPVFPDCARTGR